jgi:hypothetical protein
VKEIGQILQLSGSGLPRKALLYKFFPQFAFFPKLPSLCKNGERLTVANGAGGHGATLTVTNGRGLNFRECLEILVA